MSLADRMKILIVGAAGSVGTTLIKGMCDRYAMRGFDLHPAHDLDDTIIGDVGSYKDILQATEGMDAVIHLATGEQSWDGILHSNIVGTYNVFEAARECSVRRVAFASRAGLLSPYPRDIQRTIGMPTRPESYYSVSKAFGESLGYMYSARHDMEIVCVRIGNFSKARPEPQHPHQLGHRDAVHLFERAVVHPRVRFEIVFGVSDSDWPLYDLDHGRDAIGYNPKQRSVVPLEDRDE